MKYEDLIKVPNHLFNPFWMVFCPTSNSPKKQHPSYEDAKAEAMRLAELYPRDVFFVLAVQCAFSAPKPKPEEFSATYRQTFVSKFSPPHPFPYPEYSKEVEAGVAVS